MQLERYYEERRRHLEWRRKKKANDKNVVPRQVNKMTKTHLNNTNSNRRISNHWFNRISCFDAVDQRAPTPPQYPGSTKFPGPIEPPKTPPPTAAIHRRQASVTADHQQPLSPPNPLRLASTIEARNLPRPDTTPWLRSFPLLLSVEPLGHPSLRVYKGQLPSHLINGPLDTLVEASEKYVTGLSSGWKTDLYSLTKCDIACKEIPGISSHIKEIMRYVSQTMQILYGYGSRKISLDHNQPHILKYSVEAGHTGVELHCDRCDVTANLSLSKRDSYIGGGTYIQAINEIVKLEQGEFLFHPGCLVHSGQPITAGTRYLLVTFANIL